MKFSELEVGQAFSRVKDGAYCIKTGPGAYNYEVDGNKLPVYLSKRERGIDVIPEGEPPSSVEQARREARYHLLDNMEITADEVKELRDRAGIGMFEAQRRLRQERLLAGLDVLKLTIKNEPEQIVEIVHDMLTLMEEIVK